MDNHDNDQSKLMTTQNEGNMNDLTRNSEQNVRGNCPSNNDNDENQSGDQEDKQATEATDDRTHVDHPSGKGISEEAIQRCLDVKPSQDLNEIPSSEPASEHRSGAVPNVPVEIEPIGPLSTTSEESPGVPDTNEPGENASFDQARTTTNQHVVCKKFNKNVFFSYCHSQKDLCLEIQRELEKEDFNVWIDEYCASGDLLECIPKGLQNAPVFLMVTNKPYFQSYFCQAEAKYAFQLKKKIIPILMEDDYMAHDWLGFIKGTKLHIDFTKFPFDTAMKKLVHEIEAAFKSCEVKGNDQRNISAFTQFATTTRCALICPDNIKKWNADNVIQWLKEKKLEISQDALGGFTGEILWELYKLKFDYPPEYFRIIKSLLSSDIRRQPYDILTFNGAIESLFSSENNSSMKN
jgi:hypothetical protein